MFKRHWREAHNDELHNFYSAPNIIKAVLNLLHTNKCTVIL